VIVALVLVSALLHAAWNALLRVEPDKDRGLVGAIAIASAFAMVIALARWVGGEVPFATGAALGYTLLAGAFEAVYFSTLARALEVGRLGAVYTVSRGGAVVVVWPASIVLFGEAPVWTATAGTAVVLAGLALSSVGSARGGNRSHRAGLGWHCAAQRRQRTHRHTLVLAPGRPAGQCTTRTDLPGRPGAGLAGVWHPGLQHHRLQYAGLGGLEPYPTDPSVVLAGT
jgi:multidrug transporter EmrE-like cation transporter